MTLAAGVVFGVQIGETRLRDMRVNLGRRQTAVPEQHLYGTQVGAMVEQMGSKGVAQGVRRKDGFDSGLEQVLLDVLPKRLARNRTAPAGQIKRIAGLLAAL